MKGEYGALGVIVSTIVWVIAFTVPLGWPQLNNALMLLSLLSLLFFVVELIKRGMRR